MIAPVTAVYPFRSGFSHEFMSCGTHDTRDSDATRRGTVK